MNNRAFLAATIGCLVLVLIVTQYLRRTKPPSSRAAVVPVRGKVTFKGEPVEKAQVIFQAPVANAPSAIGTSDAKGVFVMTTFEPRDGCVPGSYGVTITKQTAEGAMTPEESQAYLTKHGVPPPPPTFRDLLPSRYAAVQTSSLSATVVKGEKNDFTFDLTE